MTKLSPPRVLGLLFLFLLTAQITTAQDVIHCWDFNTPTGTTGDEYPSPLNDANRAFGTGTISHNFGPATESFGGSSQNACSGSIAGVAFAIEGGSGTSSVGGNNGKHLDFNFSSEGYENLILSFWSRRTSTGFDNNQIQYSTTGGNGPFIDLVGGNYNPVDLTAGQVETFNISNSLPQVNNEANLVIRIIFDGASNASGNNYIDNVKLEGTPINNNDDDTVVIDPVTQIPTKTIVAADVTLPAQAKSIF